MPGSSITKLEAYLYAMGVTLSSMLSVVLHQLYFFNGHRTGMHLRIATTGCVYRKASVSVVCRGIYRTFNKLSLFGNNVTTVPDISTSDIPLAFCWPFNSILNAK